MDSEQTSDRPSKSPRVDDGPYQPLPNHDSNDFSKIIHSPEGRRRAYSKRIDAAWKGLQEDIERWRICFEQIANGGQGTAEDRLVLHHIKQFALYVPTAFESLTLVSRANLLPRGVGDPLPQLAQASEQEEAVDFVALVVGVFTSQWLLFRDVVMQRVSGNPYREGLRDLDREVVSHYARLFHAVADKLDDSKLNERYHDKPLLSFAPLVYLGNTTQVIVFNRRTPLMISVPFGALSGMPYSENTRQALAHEISHALFDQVPEVIEEIKRKLTASLIEVTPRPSRSRRVILLMIMQWLEEICADLFGTALGGTKYVQSAREVMAGTAARVGLSDDKHPPPILRPMLHLLALTVIAEQTRSGEAAEWRDRLAQEQKETQESEEQVNLLGRQFQSMPALMFVRLGTVGNALIDVVQNHLLPMTLDVLGGVSVKSLLAEISQSQLTTLASAPEEWGQGVALQQGEFVLDFPNAASPAFATPGVFRHPFCCQTSLLKDWCCYP